MFRFADIAWLWALGLVPMLVALMWVAARSRRRALDRFGESELVKKLTDSVDGPARRWKAVLQVVTVALMAVALARPQFGNRLETVRSVGQDIVVAVDLSQSMLAEDVAPNRLERARLAILRLMRQLDGDRIGLVAFAADAFVQSPLTVDYSAAGMFLNAMHPELMPVQGTDLGAAMRVSLDALEQGARDARVLVLVTDGEDHEDDFGAQMQRAVEGGVQVYLVGIGSTEGVPIPVFDDAGQRQGFLRDEDGSVVTTRLAEETLQRLVRDAGATYVRAGAGGTAFDDLVDEIARGQGEEIDSLQVTRFEEQYQIFLGLALVMLLAEALMSDRRKHKRIWSGRFE
ncbi:MAG: VWA domain-containing protein [Gemmatimonadetes bacterium]|nr:VWA domain-containing protein [Gemmatimonadota bacterium]MDA1102283.1 VWA domain-containing protein [Gemmatimonadota bacterium]